MQQRGTSQRSRVCKVGDKKLLRQPARCMRWRGIGRFTLVPAGVMQASSGSYMLIDVDGPPAPPSERWSSGLFQPSVSMIPASPCSSDASAATAFWASPISTQTMILQDEDVMLMPNSPLGSSPGAAQTDPAYTRLLAKLQRQSAHRRMKGGTASACAPAQQSRDGSGHALQRLDRVSTAPLERRFSNSLPPSRLQRGAIFKLDITPSSAHDKCIRSTSLEVSSIDVLSAAVTGLN